MRLIRRVMTAIVRPWQSVARRDDPEKEIVRLRLAAVSKKIDRVLTAHEALKAQRVVREAGR